MFTKRGRTSVRGQTLVIVAVGMVALIGMVGVVIDVGMQWGANRGAQNGSDAAAEAGAIVLMEHMTGSPRTSADVLNAVNAVADENDIDVDAAYFTRLDGTRVSEVLNSGPIPATTPPVQGVEVIGTRVHQTVFARVVGIDELSVFTDAVAVTGPIPEPCAEGEPCALLPVTFPHRVVTCDGQNKSVGTDLPWIGPGADGSPGPEYIVPLCGNNPGSVGWIDWSPPPGSSGGGGPGGGPGGGSGGSNELADEICDPDPPDIVLPDWFYVTSAGNTNSDPVQTCFERWLNKVILLPLFQATCASKPDSGTTCDDPAPIGGINQWYYFPHYAAFYLTGIYVQGNNYTECNPGSGPGGGNGATSCLKGRFVNIGMTGTVGEWIPNNPETGSPSLIFGVQLVR